MKHIVSSPLSFMQGNKLVNQQGGPQPCGPISLKNNESICKSELSHFQCHCFSTNMMQAVMLTLLNLYHISVSVIPGA